MRGKTPSISLRAALAAVAVTLLAMSAVAQTETVLRDFNKNRGGYQPESSLIFDTSGNLYGVTYQAGCGTVFELTPKAGGGWTEKVLHAFAGIDGCGPEAGLIFDTAGNLYGTTVYGGRANSGTVFELSPKLGGGWAEKVLHSFNDNGKDGYWPEASLTLDASGNLYGTTYNGGTYGWGTAFELLHGTGGGWTEKLLYSFNDNGTDPARPLAGLNFDASGNLYGTTGGGGAYNFGTVFELSPGVSGSWTDSVLYSFNANVTTNGWLPVASLIFDLYGNLYGTTQLGGAYGGGTVFELASIAGGGWAQTDLHDFNRDGVDGTTPTAGLIFDAFGNLYGTTEDGGTYYNYGTVFELTPAVGGSWAETVLHSFNRDGTDGINPYGTLIFDSVGNLYGTTNSGGTAGDGTVFAVTP